MGAPVIEFAPNASGEQPELACPKPSGTFTMEAGCGSSQPSQGTFEDAAGVPVEFDASSIDLRGATPAAYEWKIGKLNAKGEPEGEPEPYPTAAELAEKKNKPPFEVSGFRKFEKFPRTFKEAGTYRVTLDVPTDYGAYEQSALVVVTSGQESAPHAQFSVESIEGAQATFNAEKGPSPGEEGSSPGVCGTVADYRWNWGEGSSVDEDDDTPLVSHTYPSIGETRHYTVTLTVLARKVENGEEKYLSSAPVTHSVTVSAARQLTTELPEFPPVFAGVPGADSPAASASGSGSGSGPARGLTGPRTARAVSPAGSSARGSPVRPPSSRARAPCRSRRPPSSPRAPPAPRRAGRSDGWFSARLGSPSRAGAARP